MTLELVSAVNSRSPMETPPEPQPRRWFSWLRPSTWAPSQPEEEPVDDARGEARKTGQFFPFLSPNAASRRAQRPAAASGACGKESARGDSGGGDVGNESRGLSARGAAGADEKQLKREVPSIWKFLQEQEGWSFVNSRNWDVRGPPAPTSGPGATGGGGESGSATQQRQGGPMPQGQLPAFLAENPALHGRYKRWLSRSRPGLSPRPEETDEGCDDDRGDGDCHAGSVAGAGACMSAEAEEGEGIGGSAAAASAAAASAAVEAPVAAASPPPSAVPSASTRAVRGSPGALDNGGERRQRGQQERVQAPDAEPQPGPGCAAGTPSAGHPIATASAALSPPCLASRGAPSDGGSSSGGGGGSGGGGDPAGGDARGRRSVVTPPLALRTRSRGRRRGVGLAGPRYSGQKGGNPQRGDTRQGTPAGARGGGGGGGAGVGDERRAQAAMGINSPPRARTPDVPASPPPPPLPSAETSLQGGSSLPESQDVRGSGSGNDATVGWDSSGRAAPRTKAKNNGKGRRKTLLVVGGGGGGVAGRLAGSSSRRAGATAAKRRRSEVGDGGETADAGDPPRSGKRPRVKLERAGGGSNSSNSSLPPANTTTTTAARTSPRRGPSGLGASLTAAVARSPGGNLQRGGARGGGGAEDGGGDDDDDHDPLAPYARIEAETVSDDGLEGLLHTGRRDGFLDLRRYRKPGWPRPLRVTRLEASHGKRFEDHLRFLLKHKRRVEANVFLRRLEHYDRNPPHLAASLLGGGAAHKAVIPAWYQRLSAPDAAAMSSAGGGGGGSGGGANSDDDDGIEEVLDLTEKEVEVVECYDNEPLDCVMMRIVKQEPGLEEEGGAAPAAAAAAGGGGGGGGGERVGGTDADRLGSSGMAAGTGAGARAAVGPSSTAPRIKTEVG